VQRRAGNRLCLVSPNGLVHETSIRIEYCCTNNQIEYEALLFGLLHLDGMGIKYVDVFGDSLLVVGDHN
jgi:ribonuclease HI